MPGSQKCSKFLLATNEDANIHGWAFYMHAIVLCAPGHNFRIVEIVFR